MIVNLLGLIGSLALIIFAADKLVEGGSAVAKKFNISSIVIGLTIVAFGTSAPELIVSSMSAIEGQSALAISNVLGSNIFNILIIVGITSIIFPIAIHKNTTRFEVPFAILAALCILLMYFYIDDKIITRLEAGILLGIFGLFTCYTVYMAKHDKQSDDVEIKEMHIAKAIGFILFGFVGLFVGGKLLVYCATEVALGIGISERIIGITIISVGTSLPELATSIVAARKHNVDMAVGNVVGSNIFNTFLILGTSAAIKPIEISQDSIVDICLNVLAALLLFLFIFTGKGRQIERWEGIILFGLYIGYMVYLIGF